MSRDTSNDNEQTQTQKTYSNLKYRKGPLLQTPRTEKVEQHHGHTEYYRIWATAFRARSEAQERARQNGETIKNDDTSISRSKL